MSVATTKILVKVGKTSKTKFRGAQAFRAITLDELSTLARLNPDASIVVIENIKQSDETKLKQFIAEFEKANENNKVFFFVADNDSVTCGVADELAYDISLNIQDLYKAIKLNCNVTVDVDLALSEEVNGRTDDDNDAFDDTFGDAITAIGETSDINVQLPDIQTKDDFDDFDDTIIDEDEEPEDKINILKKDESVSSENENEVSIDNTELIKLRTQVEDANSEIEKLKEQIKEEFSRNKQLNILIKAIEDERDTFKDKLKLYSSEEVMEDPITLTQYQELQEQIKRLSESADDNIVSSHAMDELKETIADLEESKALVSKQLDDYKDRLRESGTKLSQANEKLVQATSDVTKLKERVAELESASLSASGTSEAIEAAKAETIEAKSEIEKLKQSLFDEKQFTQKARDEVSKLIEERDILSTRISQEVESRLFMLSLLEKAMNIAEEADGQLGTRDSEIEQLKSRISLFESADMQSKEKIIELEGRIEELSDSSTIIEGLKLDNKSLEDKIKLNEDTIRQLNDTISADIKKKAELEIKVKDADRRIDAAIQSYKAEASKAKRDALEWQTKYDLAQSQLSAKESQYSSLVSSVGMSEDGVSSVLENTKAMEEMNNSLQIQVLTLKKNLETAIRDKETAQKTAATLEESNKNMRLSMKSMTDLMGNTSSGTKAAHVKGIKYSARGMIIPVFGSGSYGITTTAMSIANKLATQARVLYIDFDIAAPKADGWFRMNPIVKNVPGIEQGSTKSTGLGLFLEKPFPFIMENIDNIVARPVQTKSGCIDYLSGLYTRFDPNKIASANYEALLNYCGNAYTYVIIDFGRLGSSDLNDQIIKAFSDIAYKNVVVTTSDRFEMRTFRMRLADTKINLNNVAWLINMCTTTRLDDVAKKAVMPAVHSMIPFSPELYGKRMNFMGDSLTRDKLSMFMETAIFKK